MLRIPFWVCIDVCKRVSRHEENARGKSLTVYLCNRAYNGKQGVGVSFNFMCMETFANEECGGYKCWNVLR